MPKKEINVGQQTEKAVKNAVESMSRNIKFTRMVNFSLSVLEGTVYDNGTNNSANSNYVSAQKAYKQLVSVLKVHPGNNEFAKSACKILLQLLKLGEDGQLPDKMVEASAAEALNLITKTPPEKDEETKQMILEIFNYLFAVSGVLHKTVVKQSKDVLLNYLDTDKPELAKAVIDCLQGTANQSPQPLDPTTLDKVLKLIDRHGASPEVAKAGSSYIKTAFEKAKPDEIQNCGIQIKDIVRSFGSHNMDPKVFRDIDVAIDKIGSEEQLYSVMDEIEKGESLEENFWIMSHLIDLPSEQINTKLPQIDRILSFVENNDKLGQLYTHTSTFLNEFHNSHPEAAKKVMAGKTPLIEKLIDEIDHQEGPYKFMALDVLSHNLDQHGQFMNDKGIAEKLKKWIANCSTPEDMTKLCDFMAKACQNEEIRASIMAQNIDDLCIDVVESKFSTNPHVFASMSNFLNSCVKTDTDKDTFCKAGKANKFISIGNNLVNEIEDFDGMLDFIGGLFDVPTPNPKLKDSFDELVQLYSTRFEKRIIKWCDDWYQTKSTKGTWLQSNRPAFLKSISNEKERKALKLILAGHSIAGIEQVLEKVPDGADAVGKLSLSISKLNCMIIQNELDQTTLEGHKAIVRALESLESVQGMLNPKTQLESRILQRYMALWCSNLALFKSQHFVSTVSHRRMEFCCDQYLQYLKISISKDPKLAYVTLLAYAMTEIPKQYIPEMPKQVAQEDDEKAGTESEVEINWSPLTIILSGEGNVASPIFSPTVTNYLRKLPTDESNVFQGYLAIREIFRFGQGDVNTLLNDALLHKIISSIDSESLDVNQGICAIFMLDGWCEVSHRAIETLNGMNAYEMLLRYMNNHRTNEILRQVTSSLLQKLANHRDDQQFQNKLDTLIKRSKEYDALVESKGDELREDMLEVYNDIYGMVQVSKAKAYCVNNTLQTTFMSTIAKELKNNPDDLLAKGSIVNFQDTINQMILGASELFNDTKGSPADVVNVISALESVTTLWNSDHGLVKGVLDLFTKIVKKSGQVELDILAKGQIYARIFAAKESKKDDPEFAALVDKAIELLGFNIQEESAPELIVMPEPEIIAEPEQTHEITEQPRLELVVEQEELGEIVITPEDEETLRKIGEEMAEDERRRQEAEQQEIEKNFASEGMMAEVQGELEGQESQFQVVQEEDEIAVVDEPHYEATEDVSQEQADQGDQELNLRIPQDQAKALKIIATKLENQADQSQYELIYKIHCLALALEIDEMHIAQFFGKLYGKLGQVLDMVDFVQQYSPVNLLLHAYSSFGGDEKVVKNTCFALATLSKAHPQLAYEIMSVNFQAYIKASVDLMTDQAGITYLGRFITYISGTPEVKEQLLELGYSQTLESKAVLAAQKENLAGVVAVIKAIGSIANSKKTCPTMTEKTALMQNILNIAVHYTQDKKATITILNAFANFCKNGTEKVRNKAVEKGLTEYFSEVFLTHQQDADVMKQFYATACNVGPIESVWTTLDAIQFSEYTFAYIKTANLDELKNALICLFLICKIDDIAEKAVFSNHYQSLDHVTNAHNDGTVLSYVLVIDNILTSSIRRQRHLVDNNFHTEVSQYFQKVEAAGKDKLLIIWVGILCKLTNSEISCKYLLSHNFQQIVALLKKHQENDAVFEKIFNLASNILIGSFGPVNETKEVLSIAFKKLGDIYTENFFTLYVNLVENLISLASPQLDTLLSSSREQIISTMKNVPLILKHTSQHIQKKFDLKFPRPVQYNSDPSVLKLPLTKEQLDFVTKGTPCKRYRTGGIIEQGSIFLDSGLRRIVFKKQNSVSLLSRDIMELQEIIKIVKGIDDRSAFAEAMKKYNLKIPPELCLMVLASKISFGETGMYFQFATKDVRKKWKDCIKAIIKAVSRHKNQARHSTQEPQLPVQYPSSGAIN